MRVDHRDLHTDFPEFAQRIHDLKVGDPHFARLFEEYDKLNHEIRALELADVPVSDAEIEKLKYRRLHLKDQLYALLIKPV
jgi:uncharacterized protein YdcH (DUF465 family)